MSRRMRSPMRVWSRTCTHSASVSGPLRLRISSGIAILPDVVQDGGELQVAEGVAAQAEAAADGDREVGRLGRVVVRVGVLRLQRVGQRRDGGEVRALEVVVQPRAAQHARRVGGEGLQRAEHAGLGGGVVDDHQQQRVGAVVARDRHGAQHPALQRRALQRRAGHAEAAQEAGGVEHEHRAAALRAGACPWRRRAARAAPRAGGDRPPGGPARRGSGRAWRRPCASRRRCERPAPRTSHRRPPRHRRRWRRGRGRATGRRRCA